MFVNRRESASGGQGSSNGFLTGLILGAVAGVVGTMIFDPQQGRTRRARVRDKVVKLRHGADEMIREDIPKRIDYLSGHAQGVRHKVMERVSGEGEAPAENDEMLNDRVMSIIFREPDVPKGDININTVAGVVYVRGSTEQTDEIDDIINSIAKVEGVRDVVNLINQPDVDPSTVETNPSDR